MSYVVLIIFILFIIFICSLGALQDEDVDNRKTRQEKNNKDVQYRNKQIKNINFSYSSNDVADKFILVGTIVKIIGYLFAIIIGIVGIIQSGNFWSGIISAIIIAFCVFISTLFYQGIAEIINLLQDIKNK